jgi:hypothetical protein
MGKPLRRRYLTKPIASNITFLHHGQMEYINHCLPTLKENLAFDEAMLLEREEDPTRGNTLRVWKMDTLAVAMGSGGKINEEVHYALCRREGVEVQRRSSGGGTVVVGAGCLGSTSLVATLRTNEPFLGTPAFALTTEQAPPLALTYLFGSLGTLPVGIPFGGGCDIWLDLGSLAGLAPAFAGPAGSASVVFALPSSPAFVGIQLGYQSLVLDASAPMGLTMSNAIAATFAF